MGLKVDTANLITRDRCAALEERIFKGADTCFQQAIIASHACLSPGSPIGRETAAYLALLDSPTPETILTDVSTIGDELGFEIAGAIVPSHVTNDIASMKQIYNLPEGIPVIKLDEAEIFHTRAGPCDLLVMQHLHDPNKKHVISLFENPVFHIPGNELCHGGQVGYDVSRDEEYQEVIIFNLSKTL